MAITQEQKDKISKLLDNLNVGTKKEQVGKKIIALIEDAQGGEFAKGAAVPDAAAEPTQSEFNALLASLRGAGLIETA